MRAGPSVRGPSLLENYFPYAQAAIEGGRLLGCSNDETVTNETEKAALLLLSTQDASLHLWC